MTELYLNSFINFKMNNVVIINQENKNKVLNEPSLLIKQFKDFNIQIYGTTV